MSIELIIFDKDGTLIDFNAMWGGWVEELARRIEYVTGVDVAEALFQTLGYDAVTARATPLGRLTVAPMSEIYDLTLSVMRELHLTPGHLEAAWFLPDPVSTARPVTDLPALFTALRARGLHIAIATTDDRAPTQATLDALNLGGFVEALVCADDGIPLKPAPDMVLSICARLNIPPAHTMMIGDTLADLHMGRAAGVGRVVGVLTGASPAAVLAPDADEVWSSIAQLIA